MRRVLLVLAVCALLVGGGAVALARPWAPDRTEHLVAAAWLPVWDERAPAALARAVDEGGLSEVSPTWATLRPDGTLVVDPPPQEVLDRLDTEDVRVIPAVQNFADGTWQGDAVARLLADPDVRRFLAAIADAVREAAAQAQQPDQAVPAADSRREDAARAAPAAKS